MNKLLEQSIAGNESLTSDVIQAQMEEFEKSLSDINALQDRYVKAERAVELTEAIGDLVELSEDADEATKAKLTRLSNAINQSFDGLTEEDLVVTESEKAGTEGVGKMILATISILGFYGGLLVSATVLAALSPLVAIGAGILSTVLFVGVMTKIENHSSMYGDPKEKEISFGDDDKIGIKGEVSLWSPNSFGYVFDMLEYFDDLPGVISTMVMERTFGDEKSFKDSVEGVAKKLLLSGPKTDGAFGKGIVYFISPAMPGDKFIVMKFDGKNIPSISIVSDSKKYSYSGKVKALDYGDTKSLMRAVSSWGAAIDTRFKQSENVLKKYQKDLASDVEKHIKKEKLDDAAGKKAATEAAKTSKRATVLFKVYADVANHSKGLATTYTKLADKCLDNLEMKEK